MSESRRPGVHANEQAFTLLVSTGRGLERQCISALREIVAGFDPGLRAATSGFSGLLKGYSTKSSRDIVRHIIRMLEERPWYNELIKRVVPIDTVVPTDPGKIVEAVKELSLRASPATEESFRVRIRRRGAKLDRGELIAAIANLFCNRVDLGRPDFEVRIEVLGKFSGVSIIRRGEIFPDL